MDGMVIPSSGSDDASRNNQLNSDM